MVSGTGKLAYFLVFALVKNRFAKLSLTLELYKHMNRVHLEKKGSSCKDSFPVHVRFASIYKTPQRYSPCLHDNKGSTCGGLLFFATASPPHIFLLPPTAGLLT